MNKTLRKKYFEMQHKLIMPEDKGQHNEQMAATVAANFASLGFPMPSPMVRSLSGATKEDIINFYIETKDILQDIVGDKFKDAKPFYPNFPEECMGKSDYEYFIDQVIYGFSGLTIEPSRYETEKERFPFIGTPMRHVVEQGSEEEFHETVNQILVSPIAFSKEQRDLIEEVLRDPDEGMKNLTGIHNMKNRENVVMLACMIEDVTGRTDHLQDFLRNPTEILRYAVIKSAQKDLKPVFDRAPAMCPDTKCYQFASLRFDDKSTPSMNLSRKDRATVMNLLERASHRNGEKMAAQMQSNTLIWKKLIRHIHISDYPKCHETEKAFYIVRQGISIDRPAKRIEEAIKRHDTLAAIKEAKEVPSVFMRKMDKLLRMAIEDGQTEAFMKALKEVAVKSSINTLTGAIGSIETRTEEEKERYFKAAKTGKVWNTKEKNREPFPEQIVQRVKDVCRECMIERFRGKEDMGDVYVSRQMENFKLPVDIRNQSAGIGGMTTGSKTPLPKMGCERFFVTWTNIDTMTPDEREKSFQDWMSTPRTSRAYRWHDNDGRVDIDLSVAGLDKDGQLVEMISWNEGKSRDGVYFSGDVQDGGPSNGPGRAEFIDIDRAKLMERGIYYIIPQVSSYLGQTYAEQPNTAFGVMSRTPEDFGKPFEPATVMNRFVLDSPHTQVIPMMLDLEKNQILWVNEQAQTRVATLDLDDAFRRVELVKGSKGMDILPLIEANVLANGRSVSRPEAADTLFTTREEFDFFKTHLPNVDWNSKTVIYPDNLSYITGVLMQDGPGEAEPERKKEIDIDDEIGMERI